MNLNMGDALLRNARRFPQKPAIVDGRRSIAYLELYLRTNRLANYLLKEGISHGDRVALSCGNRAEHVEVIFALAKIGAIAVPFDHHWAVHEWQTMMNFFEPKALVMDEYRSSSGIWDLARDRFGPKRFVAIDGIAGRGAASYEDAIAAALPEDPQVAVRGQDIFIIMITSGTTGLPKGCVIDHETYALRSLNNAISKGLNDKERGLLPLPLHLNAGRQSAMTLLYLGGTVFLLDKFDEEIFVSTIERERITYTIMVPAMCERLLRCSSFGTPDKSTLNYLGISAGHLSASVAEIMMERLCPNLYEAYASTDCGQVTILKPEDRAAHGDTVGQPIWAVLVKIADDAGRDLFSGTAGEICVRSPMAIQGYYRNPAANEQLFSNGWCRTGDIGFIDDEGYLHVSGRKKNMIKSGGISIFPEEIEHVLSAHPAVAEVAVVSCRHAEWGEAVKALVVAKDGVVLEPDALVQYCKKFLAPYKAPKVVELVATLPRTALGKIDRGKLESE